MGVKLQIVNQNNIVLLDENNAPLCYREVIYVSGNYPNTTIVTVTGSMYATFATWFPYSGSDAGIASIGQVFDSNTNTWTLTFYTNVSAFYLFVFDVLPFYNLPRPTGLRLSLRDEADNLIYSSQYAILKYVGYPTVALTTVDAGDVALGTYSRRTAVILAQNAMRIDPYSSSSHYYDTVGWRFQNNSIFATLLSLWLPPWFNAVTPVAVSRFLLVDVADYPLPA
jgi:hypothetical protein